jgi:hypothetical protein
VTLDWTLLPPRRTQSQIVGVAFMAGSLTSAMLGPNPCGSFTLQQILERRTQWVVSLLFVISPPQ